MQLQDWLDKDEVLVLTPHLGEAAGQQHVRMSRFYRRAFVQAARVPCCAALAEQHRLLWGRW